MRAHRLGGPLVAILAILGLVLLVPGGAVVAQDDPPSLCGSTATYGAGPVDLTGETAEDVGECAIATGQNLPAWRWLDATITVACEAATGSGTNRQVDGFYLWGTTRDASGAIVQQGFVGTTWQGCGSGSERTAAYHLQLVMQGENRSIAVVVERRRWPYGGSHVVRKQAAAYTGTAEVH